MSGSRPTIASALRGSALPVGVVVAVGLVLGLVTGAILAPSGGEELDVRSGGSSAASAPSAPTPSEPWGDRGSVFLIAVSMTGRDDADAKVLEGILRPVTPQILPFEGSVIG